MTDNQLADLVCGRFDHLYAVDVSGVVNAHGVPLGMAWMAALEEKETRDKARAHLRWFIVTRADQIRAQTPPGHEPELMAAGLINTFIKLTLYRGACGCRNHEKAEMIRRSIISTEYDDLPMRFMQGQPGEDVPSIGAQIRSDGLN